MTEGSFWVKFAMEYFSALCLNNYGQGLPDMPKIAEFLLSLGRQAGSHEARQRSNCSNAAICATCQYGHGKLIPSLTQQQTRSKRSRKRIGPADDKERRSA